MKDAYKPSTLSNGASVIPWMETKHCKTFSTPVTVEDACSQVNFDYNVETDPVIRISQDFLEAIKDGNYDFMREHVSEILPNNIVNKKVATVNRTNNHTLGIVSDRYSVVQNYRGFEFVNWLTNTDKETPIISTIGTSIDGGRVYVTAKMPEESFLKGDDINMYALFTNDHCGRSGLQVMFTPIRVICTNTLNMAIRTAGANRYVIRHTSRANDKIDMLVGSGSGVGEDTNHVEVAKLNAIEVMGAYDKFKKEFVDSLAYLKSKKVNHKDLCEFVLNTCFKGELANEIRNANYNVSVVEGRRGVTAQTEKFNGLMESIENGFGQDQHRGTRLWLLNGLTNYYSNVKSYRSADKKLDALMIGGTDYKESVNAMGRLYV